MQNRANWFNFHNLNNVRFKNQINIENYLSVPETLSQLSIVENFS